MPTLRGHTHWQAPKAGTQTKACQRVCLPHAEKKKLKIPFPSKNFKNATARTTLTAKPTTDKTSQRGRGNLNVCPSNELLCYIDSKVLRNPPLRQAPNR